MLYAYRGRDDPRKLEAWAWIVSNTKTNRGKTLDLRYLTGHSRYKICTDTKKT